MGTATLVGLIGTLMTGAGLILTGVGALFAARQLQLSARKLDFERAIVRHQFQLQFFDMIQRYNHIHDRLNGEGWPEGRDGPSSRAEWTELRRYSGLLSVVGLMVEDGILGVGQADRNYSHRVVAILCHPATFQDIFLTDPSGNLDFIELARMVQSQPVFREAMAGRPLPPHLTQYYGDGRPGLSMDVLATDCASEDSNAA